MTKNKPSLLTYLIVIVVTSLVGCGSFDKEKMVVQDYNLSKTYPYSLKISVDGGNDVGLIPIPKQDLQYAIVSSIRKSRVFEKIVSNADDYTLNVIVFSLEQPAAGFTMTVKIEIGWTLTKVGQGVRWQKLIKSEHTLGVNDVFSGSKRRYMATNNAVKKNIRKAIIEMVSLDLR